MRIPIQITEQAFNALRDLAHQKLRNVRQQAAWIIERDLEQRGLIKPPEYESCLTQEQDNSKEENAE